jgi:hypothetical protein
MHENNALKFPFLSSVSFKKVEVPPKAKKKCLSYITASSP